MIDHFKKIILNILKRFSRFWYWVFKEFFKQKCTARASALSLTSLLAIVPLIIVLMSVISMVPEFRSLEGQLQDFIFHNFVPSAGGVIGKYVEQITNGRVGLPIMAVAFLFIVSVMMIMSLDGALNDIWKVRSKRSLGSAFLLYWGCLTIGPMLLGGGLIINSYVASVHWLSDISLSGPLKLLLALPFIFNVCALTFIYYVIPNTKINIAHALLGAIFSAIVFEIAKSAFTLYVNAVPTYELIYGTLAAIPLFIIWVFISWQVFFLGAIVVNGLYLSQARRGVFEVDEFMLAMRVIKKLSEAQSSGWVYTFRRLVKSEPNVSVNAMKDVLNKLTSVRLVFASLKDEYIINFDPSYLTMLELYNRLKFYFPIGKYNDSEKVSKNFENLNQSVMKELNAPVADFLLERVDQK